MEIRQLQSSDIKQVIDLWTSSFSRTFDNPVNNNYLNDPNSITFVMSDNKAILGVASLHIIEKLTRKLGLIEDVAVSKNNRGLGIGKKLVEKLIQTGKEKKCDKIVLSSSEKNSEFYEKMGFQKKELSMVIRN
jgi:N-acetylglutamate synthase-like GNAT family acetyltransferase